LETGGGGGRRRVVAFLTPLFNINPLQSTFEGGAGMCYVKSSGTQGYLIGYQVL
jgi:hypothetical protein